MTQQFYQTPEVRKVTNQATDGGMKMLGKGFAWASWGLISFIREMWKMVVGK
jgi:hypothetical protein